MIDYTAAHGLQLDEQVAWKYLATREFPAKALIPNRAQFDFIKAIGNASVYFPVEKSDGNVIQDHCTTFYDSSANGQGKSANLIGGILSNIIFPGKLNIYPHVKDVQKGDEYNGFFDFPLYKQWPAAWPKRFVYVTDAALLQKVVIPEFKKWIPACFFEEKKLGKQHVSEMVFKAYEAGELTEEEVFSTYSLGVGDWEGYFLTREQDPIVFEGMNIGCYIFDEPPYEWQFRGAYNRIRMGGIIIVSATPVINSAYLKDLVKDKVDSGDETQYYQSTDIWNNSISKGGEWDLGDFGIQKKGNLTDAEIYRQIEKCAPSEYAARILGQDIHLQGRIIKLFDRDSHVVPYQPLHASEQVYFIVDPHDAKPPFMSWWAVSQFAREINIEDGNGRKLMMPYMRCILEFPRYEPDKGYETIQDTKLKISDFCEIILETEKEFSINGRVKKRIMDPFFGAKPYANTRLTTVQTYRQNGINCILGPRMDIGYGENLIDECLKFREDGPPPILTFEEHCLNTVRALENYSWVKPNRLRDDQDIASEKRQRTEKWKHGCDLIRYLLASNPRYVSARSSNKREGWRDRMKREAVSSQGGDWKGR